MPATVGGMRPAAVGAYGWLDFNSPMTEATADHLVAQLARTAPTTIVDIGCGWAELLLRLLANCPGARGIGIDHDPALIERAAATAERRGLADRIDFGSGVEAATGGDLVLCVGAEQVFGRLEQAVDRLRDLVVPGGRLLLGTLFWERPPSPALLADFGPLPDLEQLVEAMVERGWRALDLRVATAADWDRFEFGYLGDWEQAAMAPTSEAEAARRAADDHRRGYLARRGVLGFAFLTLGRPESVLG